MATARPKSGVTEYTITTGTSALTLTGAAPGFRGFVSSDDGLLYHYAIFQDQTTFETGIGTYTHGVRQLSRTTVLSNINGTNTPLNLSAGTKEVSITIPGERVMMVDCTNQILADQFFNSNRLYLDDGNSWIEATASDIFKLYLGGFQALDINYNNGLTYVQIISTNDTGSEGPVLVLRRDSNTPAINDTDGSIYVQGRDTSGTLQNFSRIRTYASSVTSGAHAAVMALETASGGALQTIMNLAPSSVRLPTGISLFTGGKTATNLNGVGAEITETGEVVGVVSSNVAVFAYRTGTRGVSLAVGFNGVYEGGLINTGGTVSVDGASLSHPSEWAAGSEAPECEDGYWVVCSAEGIMDDGAERHPLVRLSSAPEDNAVYGVTCGRLLTPAGNRLQIEATGSGRIRVKGNVNRGDLLTSSDTPGVAWRQADDIIRSSTVAKATQSNTGDVIRVIACTLLAG